jgi:hypothetical protein
MANYGIGTAAGTPTALFQTGAAPNSIWLPSANYVRTLRIKSRVNDGVSADSNKNTHIMTFTITFVNPCLTTTLNTGLTFTDMTASVLVARISAAYKVTDSASTSNGN